MSAVMIQAACSYCRQIRKSEDVGNMRNFAGTSWFGGLFLLHKFARPLGPLFLSLVTIGQTCHNQVALWALIVLILLVHSHLVSWNRSTHCERKRAGGKSKILTSSGKTWKLRKRACPPPAIVTIILRYAEAVPAAFLCNLNF